MIGVIDYGMGNLYSVSKALERVGVPYFVSGMPEELRKADAFILPGVGSFGDAMDNLRNAKLDQFIHDMVSEGRLLLGICLGMQLLFDESEEHGTAAGLGLLKGKAVRLKPEDQEGNKLKVPHMGWNRLSFHNESPLLAGVEEGYAYFVHSFYIDGMDDGALLASAEYGVRVPAVVGKENIFGAQFHPEKSSTVGMSILIQFTKMAAEQKVKK
ncbi:imidazole glycerol phosphate synthase, glutamine amidotransferase subunit [Bacillus halotolerans]|uniref:Imidazole glycerol phosphate synthase subunit HisH n=1 Tax=Bacillus halotolerans TaxID=260554 RepID=A0A9Q6AB70_9BACI|nr:imidazole glycerol phosphate synthase subunit HisH [Bacillus halotolerans]MCY8472120.1 imidazole glycerol phosphate synthase subunit HisH [Bacillus halotolerans]PLS09029.1 imidazole glycerol phosphate synthase subunit HisH [Bacillus halotolerans]PON03125.1 imidazole glycerol phosphate synthase, glutamine amidotransferase subunit [Bacillus halotolerans]QPZ42653.1 imidazole glycerol phosphate synthase subunit HisH [Bacillus halotolerans]WIG46409.1 imidazole glycerol phosphate synthase subunit